MAARLDERALGGGLPSRHAGTARKADAAASRNVPSALKAAQDASNKAAARETAALEACRSASAGGSTAPDPHHSIFTNAGFDPDASPICKQVSMPARSCSCAPRRMRITAEHQPRMCAMIKLADVKIVAKACIAHVLAIGEASAAKGKPFTDSVLEFRAVRRSFSRNWRFSKERVERARGRGGYRQDQGGVGRGAVHAV